MGSGINFTNRVHISGQSYNNTINSICFECLTDDLIQKIADDRKIKYIQISENLPEKAYEIINEIFKKRSDLYFRIFSIGVSENIETFDISFLNLMPNIENLKIEAYLKYNKNAVNIENLSEFPNIKKLHLDLFDRYDYSFIDGLSPDLLELGLYADTMGKTVNFDCKQLLKFTKLESLFLAQKAKKHLEFLGEISALKTLRLRGIKPPDFDFLQKIDLETLALLWCGKCDLSELSNLISLKNLELWRIMKLDNIDFVSSLENLEILKLQDLKHITELPDLSRLKKLNKIIIDNVPIDLQSLDESIKNKIYKY